MADEDMIGFLRRLIASVATDEAADRVVGNVRRAFGGGSVYVPSADRREEGLKMLQAGMTTTEVARELGVAPSTVYRWHGSLRSRSRKRGPGLGKDGWNL